jgi:hypothetical protein
MKPQPNQTGEVEAYCPNSPSNPDSWDSMEVGKSSDNKMYLGNGCWMYLHLGEEPEDDCQ